MILIFSKAVKTSWFLTCILSIATLGICTLIFLLCFQLGASERSVDDENRMKFPQALFYCLVIEIVNSFLHLWTSAYCHCCVSRNTFQVLIPLWILFNTVFFYSSLSAILFPSLPKSTGALQVMGGKGQTIDPFLNHSISTPALHSNETWLSSSSLPSVEGITTRLDHFTFSSINGYSLETWTVLAYYGILASKTLAFAALIITLFEYRLKIKEMYSVLDNLNFGKAV